MTEATIEPFEARGIVMAPPSKSYTHRELVGSYFSRQRSTLVGPLDSIDTRATLEGLRALGAQVRTGATAWTVEGGGSERRPLPGRPIRCRRSGTTLRFLAAVAATRDRETRLVGEDDLAHRPIEPLLRSIEHAGVLVVRAPRGRSVPLRIRGPMHPARLALDASESSQFLSALLLTLPTLPGASRITLEGSTVSRPYVEATLDVLERRGVRVGVRAPEYRIPGGQAFRGGRVAVPGDASSAAYLWSAGAVSGGSVRVRGVPIDRPQADLAILDILSRMGARVDRYHDGARVSGSLHRGVREDLNDAPDLLPLVGTLCAGVEATSRLTGVAHAARKESDRLRATAVLARAFGARVRSFDGGLEIRGTRRPRSIRWRGCEDHRLVMSAAIGALAARGASSISNARSVAKSYPGFWRALGEIGGPPARGGR